jgi:hypothetical protein
MGDYTTMIGIRDYITRDRQIRLAATELGSYHALVARAFRAFQRDPNRYTLHFHFQQSSRCRGDDLLSAIVWDQGRYLIGENIEFFAHFVDMVQPRARGGGISAFPTPAASRSQSERAETRGPPAVPSRGQRSTYFTLICLQYSTNT